MVLQEEKVGQEQDNTGTSEKVHRVSALFRAQEQTFYMSTATSSCSKPLITLDRRKSSASALLALLALRGHAHVSPLAASSQGAYRRL